MPACGKPNLKAIIDTLAETYGEPSRRPTGDPLSGLIATILSQNTSDVNSSRAFEQLRAAFPTWEQAADAPVEAIAEAIRSGGLADIKAPRIKRIIGQILKDSGSKMAFLFTMSNKDAQDYLTNLDGVGYKTAACVLLFDLGRDVFPVDTHVERISKRLGLCPEGVPAHKIQPILEGLTNPEDRLPGHLLFIAHGRRICQARRPDCKICPIGSSCTYRLSEGRT